MGAASVAGGNWGENFWTDQRRVHAIGKTLMRDVALLAQRSFFDTPKNEIGNAADETGTYVVTRTVSEVFPSNRPQFPR